VRCRDVEAALRDGRGRKPGRFLNKRDKFTYTFHRTVNVPAGISPSGPEKSLDGRLRGN
jgi:hypothetical protein